MAAKIDWDSQLGRRLKLRDLHVFATVAERRSMAKAAAHLGISQPAVSEVIAHLEQTLQVPLLDRAPRGVELTPYGQKLLDRSAAAFDELKQGVREIEHLADPDAGEVRVGCAESIATSMMPEVLRGFLAKHPRVAIHVEPLATPTLEMPMLRDRTMDILFARISTPLTHDPYDLDIEILYHDHIVLAVGANHRLAQRRRIDFAELAEEPWILVPSRAWNTRILETAFETHGVAMPRASVICYSFHLRANLLANGPFITALPYSAVMFAAEQYRLKVLPVELPNDPWPIGVVSLKNRNLSPVAQVFIDYLRDFTAKMAPALAAERSAPRARVRP